MQFSPGYVEGQPVWLFTDTHLEWVEGKITKKDHTGRLFVEYQYNRRPRVTTVGLGFAAEFLRPCHVGVAHAEPVGRRNTHLVRDSKAVREAQPANSTRASGSGAASVLPRQQMIPAGAEGKELRSRVAVAQSAAPAPRVNTAAVGKAAPVIAEPETLEHASSSLMHLSSSSYANVSGLDDLPHAPALREQVTQDISPVRSTGSKLLESVLASPSPSPQIIAEEVTANPMVAHEETHNPSGESFSQNQSGPRLDEVVQQASSCSAAAAPSPSVEDEDHGGAGELSISTESADPYRMTFNQKQERFNKPDTPKTPPPTGAFPWASAGTSNPAGPDVGLAAGPGGWADREVALQATRAGTEDESPEMLAEEEASVQRSAEGEPVEDSKPPSASSSQDLLDVVEESHQVSASPQQAAGASVHQPEHSMELAETSVAPLSVSPSTEVAAVNETVEAEGSDLHLSQEVSPAQPERSRPEVVETSVGQLSEINTSVSVHEEAAGTSAHQPEHSMELAEASVAPQTSVAPLSASPSAEVAAVPETVEIEGSDLHLSQEVSVAQPERSRHDVVETSVGQLSEINASVSVQEDDVRAAEASAVPHIDDPLDLGSTLDHEEAPLDSIGYHGLDASNSFDKEDDDDDDDTGLLDLPGTT